MGNSGEGLVIYAFLMKGCEVPCVNYVGADLIAEKDERLVVGFTAGSQSDIVAQQVKNLNLSAEH